MEKEIAALFKAERKSLAPSATHSDSPTARITREDALLTKTYEEGYVCKVCGHQLSTTDKYCPRCMAPRGKSNK